MGGARKNSPHVSTWGYRGFARLRRGSPPNGGVAGFSRAFFEYFVGFWLHGEPVHGKGGAVDIFYYVIYALILALSVSGLVVGVTNDACNFLNASLGCKAAKRNTVVAVAACGVLLGAVFSSGMMAVARSGVFVPSMFTFEQMMLLLLAVMVANVILLDIFNTLGLPTSTTVALVFALLGSAFGMAVFASGGEHGVGDYLNSGNTMTIVAAIFCSVALAFTVGSAAMWLARLIFTFRYQGVYRYIGPLWCGLAFTAITYFALFKGLAASPVVPAGFMEMLQGNMALVLPLCFLFWVVAAAVLQYGFRVNTLRLTVLAGTFSLALAFAGNDLVNFIGVFMAAKTSLSIGQDWVAAGGDLSQLTMGRLTEPVQADTLYLAAAGLLMVAVLFFSKKARKVSETELKLSSANTAKERFGSSLAARVMVRRTVETVRLVERLAPRCVRDFVARRFIPLTPEEESSTGAFYDQVRGSVNLTVAAILISVATSLELPLSTTYVTFMVAMGSSLADRAWGRDSAVYRITGVLAVVGGWFLTALAAGLAAFAVALVMAYGGFWGVVAMIAVAVVLLVKSALAKSGEASGTRLLDIRNPRSLQEFGKHAADNLGRMYGIYRAMVKALIAEDYKALKRLRKSARSMKRDLDLLEENEVAPLLASLPGEEAHRGQIIYRIQQISEATCQSLHLLVKGSYNHLDNMHGGLSEAQGSDLMHMVEAIDDFFPGLTDMLVQGRFDEIDALLEKREQLSELFAQCIERHLLNHADDVGRMRTNILYLTLLNETRAMNAHAFALIDRIRALYQC